MKYVAAALLLLLGCQMKVGTQTQVHTIAQGGVGSAWSVEPPNIRFLLLDLEPGIYHGTVNGDTLPSWWGENMSGGGVWMQPMTGAPVAQEPFILSVRRTY
jgi:hypothetical protein